MKQQEALYIEPHVRIDRGSRYHRKCRCAGRRGHPIRSRTRVRRCRTRSGNAQVNHVGARQFANHASPENSATWNRFIRRLDHKELPGGYPRRSGFTDARWSNGRVTTLIDSRSRRYTPNTLCTCIGMSPPGSHSRPRLDTGGMRRRIPAAQPETHSATPRIPRRHIRPRSKKAWRCRRDLVHMSGSTRMKPRAIPDPRPPSRAKLSKPCSTPPRPWSRNVPSSP